MKEVQNQPRRKNLNLFVYEQLKSGLRPSEICKKFNIKKTTLQYYLSSLKVQGLIKKLGYGVWSVEDPKEVQITTGVGTKEVLKQDHVRGHAFQFKLSLPETMGSNWKNREYLFDKGGLKFKKLNILGGGQQLMLKGRKVWITSKSIIIYEKESFIEERASECKSKAISHFLGLVRTLERKLKANFSEFGKYKFRVTRQHYSLIKNALAKQYNDEGKKLEIYSEKGLWFVIDNSFNLHEAETVHPKTAVNDNEKVQDFFNGVKKQEGYTPAFVVNSIAKNSENLSELMKEQVVYAENIKSHVKAIKDLGWGIRELTKLVKEKK